MAMRHAGSYDQLNLCALASVEVLARRVATIVEAYAVDPTRPRWAGLKYLKGATSPLDIVDPQLRATNARKSKEELDIKNYRNRSLGVIPSPIPPDVTAALGGGGGGGGGGPPKKPGKGDGKTGGGAAAKASSPAQQQ